MKRTKKNLKKRTTNVLLAAFMIVQVCLFSACTKNDTGEDPIPEPNERDVVTVQGNISSNTKWEVSKKYLLNGFVYLQSGAVLTIEPGTIILGDKVSKGALIVKPGAMLIAEGTKDKPIVFTSSQVKGNRKAGDWGGLILLGNASVNKNPATVEGENVSTFGGSNNTDNSGILKYVRIEFAGVAFETDKEINSLTMGGVGSGTTIDYVQVSYGGDDGFEWFGGTVNCKHLVSFRTLDDDFDSDNGYSGNVQYAYVVRDPGVADQAGDSNGYESDNDGSGSTATPQTSAKFANITVVMGEGNVNTKYRSIARIRRNSAISLYNTLGLGAFPKGILIETSSQPNLIDNVMSIKGVVISGPDVLIDGQTGTSDIEAKLKTATDKNQFGVAITTLGIHSNYASLTSPSAILTTGSPLLTAGVDLPTGLESTTYVGAFNTVDWTAGWTNFDPVNTDY